MSKAYTADDFADQTDSDLSWRLRELSDLKGAIKNSLQNARPVLLRSLVTILYAHWEGHIRFCAQKYFEHLTLRKIPFDRLERQLYVNRFIVRLDTLYRSRVDVRERCRLISEVLDSSHKRFSRINPLLVDTRSNLNSDVMKDLCIVCAVDFTYFENKTTFIDVILLRRRNSIAHGEETHIRNDELDDLIKEGIALMRTFKGALQNKVYTKSYLAA